MVEREDNKCSRMSSVSQKSAMRRARTGMSQAQVVVTSCDEYILMSWLFQHIDRNRHEACSTVPINLDGELNTFGLILGNWRAKTGAILTKLQDT